MKTLSILVLTAFVSTTPACTRSRITIGHPVLPEDAQAIVPGLSKAAVLERLGPPDHVEPEPGGSIFDYLYSRSAARALDVSLLQGSFSYDETYSRLDRLRVGFDRHGTVLYVAIVPGEITGGTP
jgi:outer membrane protein assembly factor BamE (lipoprotein component of BamABCDE complex)